MIYLKKLYLNKKNIPFSSSESVRTKNERVEIEKV